MASDAAPARILLIDDDTGIHRAFRRTLEDEGHQVVAVRTPAEAESALQRTVFDVCLLDLYLQDASGLELLPRLHEMAGWMRVVMVTAANDVSTAISAIRAGAADYLVKPCKPEELVHAVTQQLQARRLEQRVEALERERQNGAVFDPQQTESPAVRATLELARRVAQTDATLLILGENGTGKTMLAQ
ncbi:MAG: sigma-54-dependent transcriptional regulator, partial [Gammaproteobacteria bacterium]